MTLIEECLAEPVWAVVGASTSPAKWGYRAYKALLAHGYRAYPVNPRATAIDGAPCYRSLANLPETPGVVSIIVPPKLGLAVVDEAVEAGIARLWFQPGAYSPGNHARARERGVRAVSGACVLVELSSRKAKAEGRK
jgi:predicted CoA-binding protein